MAKPKVKFDGVSASQRVKMSSRRDDVRTFSQRIDDWTSTPLGTLLVFGGLALISLFFATAGGILTEGWLFAGAPFIPEIISLTAFFLLMRNYRFKEKKWKLPFRVPAYLNKIKPRKKPVLDAVSGKEAEGNLYLGMDRETQEEVWASTSDVNKHVLMIGTTGSGKTENIMGHIFGMLSLGSGTLMVDGKASVETYDRVYTISRLLGRDPDLLVMDYLTGGGDMQKIQDMRRSHTFSVLGFGGPAQKSETFISLMQDDGDIWSSRSISYVEAVMPVLSYLADAGFILLSPTVLEHFMIHENAENFRYFGVFKDMHGNLVNLRDNRNAVHWREVQQRKVALDTFFNGLPGGAMARPKGPWKPVEMTDREWEPWINAWWDAETKLTGTERPKDENNGVDPKARQTASDQYGYVQMGFTRVLGNLQSNYGYIYGAEIGEIDFKDVVLNRRSMVVLLPALERSESNLEQLGKLTVAALKTVLGSMLNTAPEGRRREIIEGNPSKSRIPFAAILDEVGYYMTSGMAVIPAQARSFGVAMYFGTQAIPDLMKKNEAEGKSLLDNTAMKYFGRLTSDENSQTAQTAINMGGKAHVQVASEMKYKQDVLGAGHFTLGEGSSLQEQFQISYKDLAAQENGEFTMTIGSKEIDDRGSVAGEPRISRMLAFFTGNMPTIEQWRRNPFVAVKPPSYDDMVREREAERGQRFVRERKALLQSDTSPDSALAVWARMTSSTEKEVALVRTISSHDIAQQGELGDNSRAWHVASLRQDRRDRDIKLKRERIRKCEVAASNILSQRDLEFVAPEINKVALGLFLSRWLGDADKQVTLELEANASERRRLQERERSTVTDEADSTIEQFLEAAE